MEAIGRLGRMKINAGVLCDEFLGIDLSLSSSKMVRTILHSSGALRNPNPRRSRGYHATSPMRSNLSPLKA